MNEKAKILIKNTFLCGAIYYIIVKLLEIYGINLPYLFFNAKEKWLAAVILLISFKEIERKGL